MFILKSQKFEELELIQFAMGMSTIEGEVEDKLLHWEFGPVMNMAFDSSSKNYLFSNGPVPFHWDGAFYKEPGKLLFYCTNSQGTGGETLFTNTTEIWNSLTLSEKELCQKVTMTYKTKKMAHYGGVIQVSLAQKHPISGVPILRVAEEVLTKLNPVELEISGEGDTWGLYHHLRAKLYDPEFLYEHSWEKGDIVICDNFTYLHGRRALGKNIERSFKRIQIL